MRIRLLLAMLMVLGLAGTARAVVYVKADSPGPSLDGNSWPSAYHTIGQAVADAQVSMEAIWVARGTYTDKVTISRGIEVYGGFVGTESSLDQRDPAANISTVDAGGAGNAFTVSADARIDGFTITNAEYGVFSESCSPTISNNSITGCKAFGVYCLGGSPSVSGNAFMGNAFGIGCESGSAVISGNTFSGNSEYAVYSLSGSPAVSGNTMQSNYGGVYSNSGSPDVEGNRLISNAACGIYSSENAASRIGSNLLVSNDDGIRTDAVNAAIIGNTIVSGSRYGVFWHEGSPTIVNNIIAFNATGLAKFGGLETTLRNDVYQNGCDYADSITYINDMPMSVDPLFADVASGDYHLAPGSPCVNAGLNSLSRLPTFDMDGEGRIYGGTVDLGADEYWSSAFDPVEVRKAPDGAVIKVDGGIVSAAFADVLYVEREDRTYGIKVARAAHGMSEGAKVNVAGKIRTGDDGERYVAADSVTADGTTGEIAPLALPNRSLGGATAGLQDGVWSWRWNMGPGGSWNYEWAESSDINNIGLLVTTWGRVTMVGDGYLYIDDGSHLDDGTLTGADQNIGVRVICDPSDYDTGDYLVVTGASSCFTTPSGLVRRILPRRPEDVRRIPML